MSEPRHNAGWQRRVIVFLLSQSATLFGSTLVQMAIVWDVTLKTSSGAWVAAFTVCSYLPQFLISFVGGVWADRHSRKALIIAADASIAAVTLAMYFAMPYISDQPLLLTGLLAMSAVRSLGAGIQSPAVGAVIPQLVPEEQLMRYNGLNATLQSVVQFAAPAAAGLLLSFSSLRSALLVDVATAALGIGLLALLTIPRQPSPGGRASVLADMKLGVGYAFSEPLIGRLLVLYGLFILLSVPSGFLAQLFVSRVFGDEYWYLTAVELTGFAGMALGGALMGVWGGFRSRVKTLLVALALFGALGGGMGIASGFPLYLGLMLIYGIAMTGVQTAVTTIIQSRADPAMQGRVFGLLGSMYSGFLPLGMAVFGPLADRLSLRWLIVGSGATLLIIAAAMAADRKFRDDAFPKAEEA